MKQHLILYIILLSAAISCSDSLDIPYSTRTHGYSSSDGSATRTETAPTKRTLLVYSAGYNNISSYLTDDIEDICSGYVPYNYPYCDNLLIFASNYKTGRTPCLIKVSKTRDDVVVRDTVRFWPTGTSAVDTETLADVLTYVKDNYPSAEYGMIFSSHATGWLPEQTDLTNGTFPSKAASSIQRSIGQDSSTKAEMDVKDFSAALPFKLNYIIFDACLTGGIEVAYELRHKSDRLVFSSEEILADGMVYTNIVSRLLEENPSNLTGVAEDYFAHYNAKSGEEQSAMISVVKCAALEKIAEICRSVFDMQKGAVAGIDADEVQRLNLNYYPARRYYFFYDFMDILDKLSLTPDEREGLEAALDECIEYKAHTEYSFGEKVGTFCGLSMYLPSAVTNESTRTKLNDYYIDYQWAQDTGYLAGYYL